MCVYVYVCVLYIHIIRICHIQESFYTTKENLEVMLISIRADTNIIHEMVHCLDMAVTQHYLALLFSGGQGRPSSSE